MLFVWVGGAAAVTSPLDCQGAPTLHLQTATHYGDRRTIPLKHNSPSIYKETTNKDDKWTKRGKEEIVKKGEEELFHFTWLSLVSWGGGVTDTLEAALSFAF